MGLIDFGAVRGMQQSLTNNRNQLKRSRKSARELAGSLPAPAKGTRKKEVIDLAQIAAFRAEIQLKRRKEDRKKLILMFV